MQNQDWQTERDCSSLKSADHCPLLYKGTSDKASKRFTASGQHLQLFETPLSIVPICRSSRSTIHMVLPNHTEKHKRQACMHNVLHILSRHRCLAVHFSENLHAWTVVWKSTHLQLAQFCKLSCGMKGVWESFYTCGMQSCNHAFAWGVPVVPLRNLCLLSVNGAQQLWNLLVLQIQQQCIHVLLLLSCCSGHRLFSGQTGAPWAGCQSVNNDEDCLQAVDLLQRMLRLEPSQRPSVQEALSHPFLRL